MWIGFSIKELSHLTISTAIAAVKLEMISLLFRERSDIYNVKDSQRDSSPMSIDKIILDSFSTPYVSSLKKKRGRYGSSRECDDIRCDTEIPGDLPQLLFSETFSSSSSTPSDDFVGIGTPSKSILKKRVGDQS